MPNVGYRLRDPAIRISFSGRAVAIMRSIGAALRVTGHEGGSFFQMTGYRTVR